MGPSSRDETSVSFCDVSKEKDVLHIGGVVFFLWKLVEKEMEELSSS